MRHERIIVKRDNNTVHNLTVAPWEVQVLEYLFDEGNVERPDKFVNVPDREYPDAHEEMMRLQKAYGADVKTDIPHVNTVYGQARAGVRALAKAIEEAREEEEEAIARPKPRNRMRPHMNDRLLA